MHVSLKEVSVNRGSVQYLMEIGSFSPGQVLCKLNVVHVNVTIYNGSFKNMHEWCSDWKFKNISLSNNVNYNNYNHYYYIIIISITVKPLLSGHLRGLPKYLLNRGCPLNRSFKNCTMFVNDQHLTVTLYCEKVACR